MIKILLRFMSDDKKIEMLNSSEVIDSDDIFDVIISIKDEDKRIKAMQQAEEYALRGLHKRQIIISIKDEEKRINVMHSTKNLGGNKLDENDIREIINTIKDERKRIELMSSIKEFDLFDKIQIISMIKDDQRKIELMQTIDTLKSEDKMAIFMTIEDEKKIEVINKNERLSNEDKTIILSAASEDTIKQLMTNSNLSNDVWNAYRILYADLDFINDNMDFFLEKATAKLTNIDEASVVLSRMYKKNNEVVKGLDFRLLEHKYLETLGEERINLISCYTDIQEQILKLTDEQLYIFDKCIDVYAEQNETDEWTVLAQDLLEHLGEYDSLIESLEDKENISKEDIVNLARIMQGENWCEINSIDDAREYDRIKEEKCKAIMEDENATLKQKKQAVYQKLFGHDLLYAKTMINKYGEDIENIDDCEMKDYIRTLKMIDTIDNVDVLQEIFEKCDFAKLDKVLAERELKTEYGKKYFEDLYVPQEGDRQDQISNIYEAGTEFKIILTSIGAFSGKTDIDNYKNDWNRPVISTQHFCASYIRNDMIGTAPIHSICYGFSQMKEDALMLSGTGDIYSSAETFESIALHNERYFTPNVQIDNTSGYNEMDFRRIQGGVKLQPDYIIVFRRNGQIENMEEAQKASEQWDGMPIVVIDVDKCLEVERAKVDIKLAQYRENPSIELAREITQKVRNNRQTDESFCYEVETELELLRSKLETEEKSTREKSARKQENIVSEEELEENNETVSAKEREQGIRKIREIYKRVKEITKERKDDER